MSFNTRVKYIKIHFIFKNWGASIYAVPEKSISNKCQNLMKKDEFSFVYNSLTGP